MPTTDWNTATDEQILAADLIIEQGLDELAPEDQQRVLESMNAAIEEAVLMKALAGLDDTSKAEIQAAIASGDAEHLRTLLATKVPTYDQLYQETVLRYKRVMLTGEAA